ncbi:hypothetical protein DPMN_185973 [Dreissena polymorpha]|uniref:Uncharacterized protein n=1 Tax=Dreissena polymorpha TaxID=45954 RepID=A0A9D4DNU5_DREPO|nr:hypothetical protein DPMN_185973 [Dreissena polymorpha]
MIEKFKTTDNSPKLLRDALHTTEKQSVGYDDGDKDNNNDDDNEEEENDNDEAADDRAFLPYITDVEYWRLPPPN